ncbi:WecB/TagA/CpsF family glycosyltransferase, partial [Planktotalea sp.]|uniref:WecB/TagA/CpsF family glycosyltransferase n=1 Tax=Planktotalea sp. TaxID=2029877 RepID=UPI003299341B
MTLHAQFNQSFDLVRPVRQTYISSLSASLVDMNSADAISALLSPGRKRVAFMNAHCFNVMARDRQYAAAVQSADMLLPDGSGVAIASKLVGKPLTANLNGTDLIPELVAQAAKTGKSIYLFGGTPGTAEATARALVFKNPGLRIAGTRDGFAQAADDNAVIADINISGADIVLVAMGVPKQDLWLYKNAHRINADLTMGVGAAFDFISGNVPRAPKVFRKVGCEWIWRLGVEPRRMANRYLVGNVSFLARSAMQGLRKASKGAIARRSLDIAIAGSAALILSPLLLLAGLAVKLDSEGPALFRQTRVGKNGRNFEILKFRSMCVDAEQRRKEILKTSDREGLCFKSKTDPRITRVGRFIRRFSIDELPQLINVLRGEMSIVGPRPALPTEVDAYPVRALGRLAVKPGITGIW